MRLAYSHLPLKVELVSPITRDALHGNLVNANSLKQYGFTILEVMVAMVIMGISIGVFFSLMGNSARLSGKINDHAQLLFLAETKTEEAFLGLLEKNYTGAKEKRTAGGTTKEGISWKACEVINPAPIENNTPQITGNKPEDTVLFLPHGIKLLTIQVEGITIDTISLDDNSTENEEEVMLNK